MGRAKDEEILLICYPRDETFENGIRTVIDDLDGLDGLGHGAAESVELKLHERFPELQIVVHESLDTQATAQTTWIVFRDRDERISHGRDRAVRQPDSLPAADPPPETDSQRALRLRQPVALVVDDEALVLMLISMVLTARGWLVIQASNGDDALAKAEGAELDLLVTDDEMPGMDGRSLAHRLCQRDSSLPVLMVSGSPEASIWAEEANHAFLAKPFGIEALAARVESLTGYATAWNISSQSNGA
jgi:CheY-like chemotaxis protein